MVNSRKISIAIDGPAAAGKSTVAKIVAEKLNYVYVDTGAMYRAITYKILQENINIDDNNAITILLHNTLIDIVPSNEGQQVILDGENITKEIRDTDVTNFVAKIASLRLVREELVKRQQNMGENGGVVMDGRDIGTAVLPNAELKVFLRASVEIRAHRRHLENTQKGYESDLEKLKEEIASRDKQDSERAISPLKKAVDAIELDSSNLTIDEVVQEIYKLAIERIERV